jgi:hypothetical protein
MRILFLLAISISSLVAAVDGVVVNGTSGKPQAAVAINLVQPSAAGMQNLATVKSGADGKFSIEARLSPGPVLVQATFQGVTYTLPITPGSPTTNLTVNVFDATTNPASGKIAQHIVVLEPTADALKVTETFLSQNQTTQTYQDSVKGSIQFYLPESARDKAQVTIAAPGGMPINRPAEKTKVEGVYKASYPLKPGETRFDVAYTLPPGDTFSGKNAMPGTQVTMVAPLTVTLSGDGIEDKGQVPNTQARVYATSTPAFEVKIAGTGSINETAAASGEDTGQDQPEVQPARIYSRLYWVLGLTLGILALGGVALYRKGAA